MENEGHLGSVRKRQASHRPKTTIRRAFPELSKLVRIISTASDGGYANTPVGTVHLVPTASERVHELAPIAISPRGHLIAHVDVVGLDAVEEQLVRLGIHLG